MVRGGCRTGGGGGVWAEWRAAAGGGGGLGRVDGGGVAVAGYRRQIRWQGSCGRHIRWRRRRRSRERRGQGGGKQWERLGRAGKGAVVGGGRTARRRGRRQPHAGLEAVVAGREGREVRSGRKTIAVLVE
jgi:hypothetical protein